MKSSSVGVKVRMWGSRDMIGSDNVSDNGDHMNKVIKAKNQ